MQRILVIGSGGAGKSTFAAELARRLALPLIHLDALYWKSEWTPTPKDKWARLVAKAAAGERWIMDGNYGGTLDLRLGYCDAVVFLDMPRLLCLWRVVRRSIRFHGRSRPEMSDGCPERLSWE